MIPHQNLTKRLARLERLLGPAKDDGYTLEELCREIWQGRKSDFMKLAHGTCFQCFVTQFEREAADAKAARRRCPRPR